MNICGWCLPGGSLPCEYKETRGEGAERERKGERQQAKYWEKEIETDKENDKKYGEERRKRGERVR